MKLILVSIGRYGPPLSIDTKTSTIAYQFYPNTLYFITREKLKLPVEAVKTDFFLTFTNLPLQPNKCFRHSKHHFKAESLLFLMVFNSAFYLKSKLRQLFFSFLKFDHFSCGAPPFYATKSASVANFVT